MSVGVYFHLYAAGAWEQPTTEFLDAMVRSGLAEEARVLRVGLIGSPAQCGAAYARLAKTMPIEVIAHADEGWEQVTLEAMRQHPVGDQIGYFHTKGAAIVDPWQDAWRRSMYLCLVTEWRTCLPFLETDDAVGCHWLLVTPGMPQRYPFFGGNMWWARRSLIDRLEPPEMSSRYAAEAWIGSAEGVTAKDLRPGWPGWDSIRQEARRPAGVPL